MGYDPFYARVVNKFYKEATSRHTKLLFARTLQYGFAVCKIPPDFATYFKGLESSARGNYRKAQRAGYVMRRFNFNEHLDDAREIWKSTPVRQGKLPRRVREGLVQPVNNPPSRTPYHDYPYFGVFRGNKLFAYASCLVAGEICNLADLYGHAYYESEGVIPMLVIEMVQELFTSYPNVKYFGFGTYFGASENLRRFKRKLQFFPYYVTWILGSNIPNAEA
jgi:hypothetical protein